MRIISTKLASVAALTLGLGLAACGGDGDGDDASTTTTTASEDVVFDVDLRGDVEVPGPGATGAGGTAQVTVTPGSTEVCYELTVTGLDDVTAAHIHEGRDGTAGPVAVTLEAPIDGESDGCVETSSSIVGGLADGNRSFYVNVHTTEFPDGAVRAQLTG